jgi:hypothetical protein
MQIGSAREKLVHPTVRVAQVALYHWNEVYAYDARRQAIYPNPPTRWNPDRLDTGVPQSGRWQQVDHVDDRV